MRLTVARLDLGRPPDHVVRVLVPHALGVLLGDVGAVAEHGLVGTGVGDARAHPAVVERPVHVLAHEGRRRVAVAGAPCAKRKLLDYSGLSLG